MILTIKLLLINIYCNILWSCRWVWSIGGNRGDRKVRLVLDFFKNICTVSIGKFYIWFDKFRCGGACYFDKSLQVHIFTVEERFVSNPILSAAKRVYLFKPPVLFGYIWPEIISNPKLHFCLFFSFLFVNIRPSLYHIKFVPHVPFQFLFCDIVKYVHTSV